MLALFRHRNFALLWVGQFVSSIGDWVLIVALPFYTYQLTGSILQTGGMFIVETLPRILLGSFAGVFVDRWNRRWTMIVSDILRAGFLLLLLFVHSSSLVWLIYLVACIQAIVSQFFNPAYSALTPTLVDEQQLTSANALEALSDALNRFIGPPLGGALLGLIGLTSVVLVDSVSFLFSAFMVLLIILPSQQQQEDGAPVTSTKAWRKVWHEWLEGLRVVKEGRVVMAIFVTMGIVMVAQGVINVSLVVFVQKILHGGASIYGLLITTQGIGTLLGTFLVAYASKVMRPAFLAASTLWIAASALFIFISFPSIPIGIITISFLGIFAIIFFISVQTWLQKSVADSYRGRVFGSFSTTLAVATLIGLSLASALGDYLGSTLLLKGACVLFALAGAIALFMFSQKTINLTFLLVKTLEKDSGIVSDPSKGD